VYVPPLVYEGQRLRLRGLGFVDVRESCLGDLFLTVRLGRHKRFRVVGSHLSYDLSITPWEAALGARLRLETLDGMMDVHVPAGSQPGSRLRLPERGLPQKDGKRGDLFLSLVIKMPTVSSEKERELWRALAQQYRRA
jgi:curved DNA-binding protein